MEVFNSLLGIPYVFHGLIVSAVLVGAVLLFIFGIKPTEEPNFNKIKADSKPNSKKKKGKENKKVVLNGVPSSIDLKAKSGANVKTKSPKSEDKGKKSNALKDSKNVNINAKNVKKESAKNESKKKGKENFESNADFSDEDGYLAGWEQALSRKDKKRKLPNNIIREDVRANDKKLLKGASPKNDGKKQNEGERSDKNTKKEKKQKLNDTLGDDAGVWQEAKSSKKRRKIQKEA